MKKISTRFAVLMALAGVAPLLAYGAISVLYLRDGTRNTHIEGAENTARQVGEQIELYVTSSVRILQSAASQLQETRLESWQKRQILRNYVLDFPEFKELTLLDDQGTPLASSRFTRSSIDIPGTDGVEIGGALMSRFTLDDDLLPTAVVAVRLSDLEGAGWLVARLSLEELWRMVDRIRIGEAGFALVVTGDGQLLAHGNPLEKSTVASGANLSDLALVKSVRDPAQSSNGVAQAEYETGGIRMLGVAAHRPALGWTVIVEQPVAEAFAVPAQVENQLGIAIAIALLLMVSLGYVWGRSFINPILTLTRGTRALAEGRLDERVVVNAKDELGQLGTAFNNMADRLVELQEDVKKQERQAMFGRVSIGLVHDLSNPIQNIGNACKMIVMMFDDLEYRATFKRTVERELAQIKRMLDDLRNIAKPVPLQKFPLDLNKTLAELVESMHGSAQSSGLSLETALSSGPLFIEGDLYALNRVYGNLIKNALQATASPGTVTVRTRREPDRAAVEIADTGSGIPADRLATIFDDFVTTKRRGLGLGLAISKKIVEQLGGTIEVASEVGRGTTFAVRFPLTSARPEQLAS